MGKMFNAGAHGLLAGTIDWATDTIRIRPVLTSAGEPDTDATAMTGLGVTGNDQTLAGKTGPTKDDTNDRVTFDANDPVFAAQPAGGELNRAIVFKFVTDDAGSIPICLIDIQARTPNGGDITVNFDAAGVILLPSIPA